MSGKCGPCGVSDGAKKCPKPKKESGFSKTPCKKDKKPKCNKSYEKFQQRNKCGGAEEETNNDSQNCHKSQEKFHKKENCQEDQVKNNCTSSKPVEKQECKGPEEKVETVCSQKKKDPPCSNAFKRVLAEKQAGPCGKDSSAYSKLASTCRNLAKDFVKLKPLQSDCPEDSLSHPLKDNKNLPPTEFPCPPRAEKGEKSGLTACSSSKVFSGPCPDKGPPSWRDFFPLDARNDKLNACIEKYTKIDPNQVIARCSQFAGVAVDTTDKCAVKKDQPKCMGGMPSDQPTLLKRSFIKSQLPPKYRVLMSRWAPSAALYLSSTALFGLYVTEWKPVLRYVPLYGSYVRDLELSEGSQK